MKLRSSEPIHNARYRLSFADSTLAFVGVGPGEARHRALIERVAERTLDPNEAVRETAAHFGVSIDRSLKSSVAEFDDYLVPSGMGLRSRLVDALHPQGIEDQELFRAVETELSRIRAVELAAAEPPKDSLDYDYFRMIHRKLFEDVYPWAGEQRVGPDTAMIRFAPDTIGFEPGDPGAPMVKYSFYRGPDIAEAVSIQFAQLTHLMTRNDLNRDELFDRIAEYGGELLNIHPFRDGNMRAQWAYAVIYDEAIGYPIDTERALENQAWRQQTVHAGYHFQATTDHLGIRDVMDAGLAGGGESTRKFASS